MKEKKHLTGLTDAEVVESRKKHGANILTPPEKESLWKLFLEKFEDPIIRILLIAAILSLGVSIVDGEYAETIGIFCAIFLATGVAFWFELDANKKFDILNQVNDDIPVKVIRNGNICEVLKKDIVVGDLVVLNTGDEVPADGLLLEAVSLQINESCLTGEPVIDKTIHEADFDKDATYASNMALKGTSVVDGHGIMEISTVGDATEFGKVAQKSMEMTGEETPLNMQLDGLAKFIGVVGFVLAALTFAALFLKEVFTHEGISYAWGNWSQLGLLAAAMIGALVALTKIWLPIIYDAFELAGKEKELPKSVDEGSWIRWILYGILVFALICGIGLLFGVNPLNSESWITVEDAGKVLRYFMVAVTLIVVAVPEGLPMSVTLSLAMSMKRMLQTNNLVRKMHACETMGATTVICTDKTGTLTQNQMQVYATNFFGLNEQKFDDNEISKLIQENISSNSTAFLDYSDKTHVKPLGNPTEAALLLWLHNSGINYLDIRENSAIVDQLTFSTERKYMATIIDSPDLQKRVLYVKGAPEIVMGKCSSIRMDEIKDISVHKSEVEKLLQGYQNQAMRTLGFAYRELDNNEERSAKDLANEGLIFLGVVAISDPVRPDVPVAVGDCLNAGIKVKIVTGDTPGTAKEIGRQIGIWSEKDTDENIIIGTDFEKLSDEEAAKCAAKLKIMCRARPTDKQRLVQLLQQNGEIVAVTGDGTNDAPALNHANVGLSMGSGTSVAKEASDITLLDDSFHSIATAVMWGRSLYANIQRFILFQLTINVAALVIVFLGSIFGHELPLTVTQMLWVNLIMDTFAAGALASLPPNPNVMKEKPRKNSDFIITAPMGKNILFAGFSFVIILLGMLWCFSNPTNLDLIFNHIGENVQKREYALSFFFTVFVMLQFWNMFNAKAFNTGKSAFVGMKSSIGFILVAIVILIGQVLIVEFGGDVFRTIPLMLVDWVKIIAATSVVLWIGEISRFFASKTKE